MKYKKEASKNRLMVNFMAAISMLLVPVIVYALIGDIWRTVIITCAINLWMITTRNIVRYNKLVSMYEQAYLEEADKDTERVVE